jgi:amiloride-sensitive sodium channel
LHENQEVLSQDLAFDIKVQAEIIKSDPDMKKLDLSIRKCYFDNERKLKFFKIYTQKNCEQECVSFVSEFKGTKY